MTKLVIFPVARGLALFLGGFSLLNLLGELRSPGFDANLWWIDLRSLPSPILARLLLSVSAAFLIAFAIRPRMSRWRRISTAVLLSGLLLATFWNAIRFYSLLTQGTVHALFPVPFSLFTSLALLLLLVAIHFPSPDIVTPRQNWSARFIAAATLAMCLVTFPLAQMVCFGLTDYRRPVDAIVVFGARVFSDGTPSPALEERIRTGCRLYLDGLASQIIFSGGPGKGAIDETEAMRRLAIELGVPDSAIVKDPHGLDTQATVQNTTAIFPELGVRRVLAVSHFYHLPRIKMTYRRAGWEVYTVPSERRYLLGLLPYFMAREVVALWAYYLRPLSGF